MVRLADITRIDRHPTQRGYLIEFNDGRSIHLTRRRTIVALLILIEYGEGTEADLAQGSTKIPEIKTLLQGKIPDNLIQNFYGDANKPFSELWNEEGFTWIDNLRGGRRGLSQRYILHVEDHERFFTIAPKANRSAPSALEQLHIRARQNGRCNLCGAAISTRGQIGKTTFAKDRRREVFDHRKPVEKGGTSELENYQALCFYCNKSKWQICNICLIPCDPNCALVTPERNIIIAPTGEDISDLLANRSLFNDPEG